MIDAKTLANKFIRVQVTPQGTADVYLGDVHIKTFGIAAAAYPMRDQLALVLELVLKEWDDGKLPDLVKYEEVAPKKKFNM